MQDYKLSQEEFKELNLVDKNNQITLDKSDIQKLKDGGLTDEIKLENVRIDDQIVSFNARLGLNQNEAGDVKLTVYPVFKEHQNSSQLSDEENQYFRDKNVHSKDIVAVGTIKDYGKAPYQNNSLNSDSFYIKLEDNKGNEKTVWGKDLEEALLRSNKKIGDEVVINNKGVENVTIKVAKRDEQGNKIGEEFKRTNKNLFDIREFDQEKDRNLKDKNMLFQYDGETKSFKSIDTDKIDLVHTINEKIITDSQKEDLKKGKTVKVDDETEVALRPAKSKNIISNKFVLLASIAWDGGLSYLIIKAAQKLNQTRNQDIAKKEAYSKGYQNALEKLRSELLQKQAKYPNNTQINRDLNIVDKEISSLNVKSGEDLKIDKQDENKDVKLNVNDPDTYEDANREKSQELNNSQNPDNPEKNIGVDVSLNEEINQNINMQENIEPERSFGRGR